MPDNLSDNVTYQRKAALRLLAVSAVIFAASFWARPDPEPDPASDQEPEPDPAREEGEAPEAAPPPPRAPKTYQPGASTPVPRPGVGRRERPVVTRTGDGVEEAPEEEPEEEEETSGPIDRREDPPPDSEALMQAIKDTMAEVTPAVSDCLTEWWMLDPALEGRVMMNFQLGPEGLGEVRVQDHTDVPMGPLSCFGAAIYEAEWPATEDPVEVTYPFVFFNDGEE